MEKYKLVKKGIFESHSKFEKRINSIGLQGYRAISISHQGGILIVLMEKV